MQIRGPSGSARRVRAELVWWWGCVVLVATPLCAWLRAPVEDAIVVERSELIVVGHVKEGSITYVPHEKEEYGGRSWEHHAILVVSRVLKGEVDAREIPIVIHYGLAPRVGGRSLRTPTTSVVRSGDEEDPDDRIEIFDSGSSAVTLVPLVHDAREDHLWFLRKRSGRYGEVDGDGDYGVVDPEDLRPLVIESYLMAYLGDAPEETIRRQQRVMADTAQRAQRYLDHLAVERALDIEDVSQRLQVLKRFYLGRQSWDHELEARDAIIASGTAAAGLLTEMFDDPSLVHHRADIILLFRAIDHREAAPKLVRLLETHDAYWREAPKIDWDQPLTQEIHRRYAETYQAVYALERLGDERAVPVVQRVKQYWMQSGVENDQIVESCDRFLERIAKPSAD